ncbi:tRNA (adenosine(37)-N6)-threonylcarbamoyltransferase complex dimerization subunit type 1 TsaB [Thermodesulfatator autotrophicus]|nr:tRNA (adenosine(37)-N6)-threonylcarbamoyltransferase complex dimerization subunit type 1 TsaB [Thermodesulfatator autotrophicus]
MKSESSLVLGIETASPCGGVAVVGEELLGEITLSSQETHSRRLMLAIDYLLKQLKLGLKDIAAIGIGLGPGSFTGLRIGLATAKGLHLASGLPLIGISTLKALAYSLVFSEKPVCAALDARRSQVYAAIYKPKDGHLEEIMPPALLSPEKLASRIKEPAYFVGDGAKTYFSLFKETLENKFLMAPPNLRHIRPANVAFLARRRYLNGKVDNPFRLLPIYLRPSEAELKKAKPGASKP